MKIISLTKLTHQLSFKNINLKVVHHRWGILFIHHLKTKSVSEKHTLRDSDLIQSPNAGFPEEVVAPYAVD